MHAHVGASGGAFPFALRPTPIPLLLSWLKPVQTLLIFSKQLPPLNTLHFSLLLALLTSSFVPAKSIVVLCLQRALLTYFLLFSYFISEFVLNSGGKEDAACWAPFDLVSSTVILNLSELRPCRHHPVSNASGLGAHTW